MEIIKISALSGVKYSIDYQAFDFGVSVTARLEAGEDFEEVMEELQLKAREAIQNAVEEERYNNGFFRRGLKRLFETEGRVSESRSAQKKVLEKKRRERADGDG